MFEIKWSMKNLTLMLRTRNYRHIKGYLITILILSGLEYYIILINLSKSSCLDILINVLPNLRRVHNTRSVNKISMSKIYSEFFRNFLFLSIVFKLNNLDLNRRNS